MNLGRSMSNAARLIAMLVFAIGYLTQPLALDACAVSCEAARAARGAVVAAPCHHSSSCAKQISQPTNPASTVAIAAVAPPVVVIAIESRAAALPFALSQHPPQHFSSPPIPLRV
jgi:hypothetical protein